MARKTKYNKSKKQRGRKTVKKVHGGNCGCACHQQQPSRSFFGGTALQNGTVFGGISGSVSGAAEESKLTPANLKGGSPFGAPSFDGQLAIKNYYPLNEYNKDPQYMQEASRLNPNMVGGKRGRSSRKNKKQLKQQKQQRKMRGGIPFSLIRNVTDPIYNSATNVISSVGNVSGSLVQSNILNGVIQPSYNPTQTNPVIKQYV